MADGHVSERILARDLPLSLFLNAGDPFRLELLRWSRENEAPLSIVPIFLTIMPEHRILAIVVLLAKLLLNNRCPHTKDTH